MKASPAMSKTTRILTVDDSASMRALLNHALTSQGFDVAQAEDNYQVRELQSHAVERIDESIRLTESVMIDRERFGEMHERDRDYDRDRR